MLLIGRQGAVACLATAVAGLLFLSACGASAQSSPAPGSAGAQAKPGGPPPAPVTTARAEKGPIKAGITFTGDVTASKQVNLAPKVAGLVLKLLADVGSEVKAGQLIAELDHMTQDAAAAQAQAQVEVAQANLAKMQGQGRPEEVAKAQAALAQQQARLDLLQKQGRPETVGQSQAKLDQDMHQVENDRAALETAKAKLAVLLSPQQQDAFRQAVATAKNNLYSAQVSRDALCAGVSAGQTAATGRPNNCEAAQASVNASQTALDQANDSLAINVDANTVGQTQNAVKQAQAALDKDLSLVEADKQALALAKNPNTPQDIAAQQAVVNQAQQQVKEAAQPFVDTDLQSAQANVNAAQANLEVAKVNQQLTQVTAPFDGIISARLLAEGALATTTVPIFTIISRELEVDLPLAQEQLGQIKLGQSAQLTTTALAGQVIDGKIESISPAADPRSRTFLVRVVPAVQDGKLMPGMSANVIIDTVEKADALLIPRDAVTSDSSGRQGVYVIQSGPNGQVAAFRAPTLGVSDGKSVEVLNGLNPGDLVIVAGQTSLNNNQPVRLATGAN